MADILRFDPPVGADPRRCAAGVAVAPGGSRISAALVWAEGRGLAMRARVGEGITAQLPAETVARLAQLADRSTAAAPAATVETIAILAAELAGHQAALLDTLLSQSGVAPQRILVVGVLDLGLWGGPGGSAGTYVCLGDPARLAELTGLETRVTVLGHLQRGGVPPLMTGSCPPGLASKQPNWRRKAPGTIWWRCMEVKLSACRL